MIKLKNILNEVLNTFQVEVRIISNRKIPITSILDQIRGLEKVTIVNNITPEGLAYNKNKEKTEYTRVKFKFVTRTDPKQDLIKFKEDMLTSDMSKTDLRIPGVISVVFHPETLKRL
tara:strand:+ start:37 stop:387 length:351 start_codon:yes stop_codon:yes gene_type:complete